MPYKDPLKNKECQKLYRIKNKERYRQLNHERYVKNKEHHVKLAKIWKEKNKEKNKLDRRKYWFRTKYGITLEERERMIQSQGNKCMICGNDFRESRNIHVDHDHKTGKIRDMLCDYCNGGLGLFRDDTVILQKAINYLLKWGS